MEAEAVCRASSIPVHPEVLWSPDPSPYRSAPEQIREVCHDLRQPVAGVLRLAATALAQPGLPDAARSCLEQIVAQTASLSELIHDWLYADEPDQPTPLTDLRRLAAEAVAAERLTYEGQVKFLSPTEPVLICVTRADARRTISNLLSNATRAAGAEGTVWVKVARDCGHANVTVEDTGPGLGKVPQGTGLGLSIIAQSLVRCGGRLECGPRKGAECVSACGCLLQRPEIGVGDATSPV